VAYNAAVATGEFGGLRPARTIGAAPPRPIATPPFHAAPLCVGLTFSMGGPAVDEDCRVLRKDGSKIPGLFVIGSAIGGLEGGETVGYWGGLSQAMITGLLASEYVATHAAGAPAGAGSR
jgi:fumarate reductase flavoprotein subunit